MIAMGGEHLAGKRSAVRKQLLIFTLSLSAVLLTGTLAMAMYSVLRKMPEQGNENTERATIDFAVLGKGTTTSEQYELAETGEAPMVQEDEKKLAENERLYSEAVANGENVWIVECADSERVTFAFAGDVLLDDAYAMMYQYRNRGSDINDTFSADLLERMRSADVFMLNNEFPFSTGGTPTQGKQFTFRANPSNIEIYKQIGVDVVSLANNHAYDYGETALMDTFTTLENAQIPYVGAGRNIDDAKKPLYLIANGIKIGIVSATQIERNATPDTKEATATNAGVLRCMDPASLLEVIAEAKANSDFVILYIHWGTESQEQTDWLQEEQAPIYAQAGVDLIIGDHPHCLQRLDVIAGVPVVYSLGNFWFNSKTQNTCLVEITVSKDGMETFQFIPCIQKDCRTIQLEGNEKDGVLNYMRGLSPNVLIDNDGYVTFK